jgi:mono/diheme cytochrome c family protein
MPDFGFSAEQARFVAGFLLALPGAATVPSVLGGDAERGKTLVAAQGCAACHGIAVSNRLRAPDAAVTRAGGVSCPVADYGLTTADQAALQEFLTRDLASGTTAVEAAEREYRQQRCAACHRRDAEPSVLSRVAREVAELVGPDPTQGGGPPAPPPDLTAVGAKLQTPWLTAWLAGADQPRPRPWITGPMPTFHLDAARVARGLAQAEGYAPSGGAAALLDGMAPSAATAPTSGFAAVQAPEAELRSAGARLLPLDGGFGCTNCHGVGDAAARQVFEAPGVNLALAAARLRKEFFYRWLWDPTRVDPGTKMTRFIDADGRSGLTEVFGGDGAAQVEALWQFLVAPR